MTLTTCITPEGRFVFGIHRPAFRVENFRANDRHEQLGTNSEGSPVDNLRNFPVGEVSEEQATWIYEIPNPFPFRGVTFIKKDWADLRAENPSSIKLPTPPQVSLTKSLRVILDKDPVTNVFASLPRPILLATATTSTDPEDLLHLAEISCTIQYDPETGEPNGLAFKDDSCSPEIHDHALFEALVNNPSLPDNLKNTMVLKPGIQGASEIIGEYGAAGDGTHVFEYLRRNSYIPWGHYASNMANDSIRYSIDDLNPKDMSGLRHLYYQRTYCRMAKELDIDNSISRKALTDNELEELRVKIVEKLKETGAGKFNATLWGWNFGFDFAPSHYRLHASHQQIHQQYAMIPGTIEDQNRAPFKPYCCGDMVAEFSLKFRDKTGHSFFNCYLEAINNNSRMDGRTDLPSSLVVFEDKSIILFVPKAQTSQWELNIICKDEIGNILECDTSTRNSLDQALLKAQQALAGLGARMVTSIEFSKRFDDNHNDQRLLYSLLPRLPESPGAFSEAQFRFINGHYPEDFAEACRRSLSRETS